jgi:hypothetical protein
MTTVEVRRATWTSALAAPLTLALAAYVMFGLLLLPHYWSFYFKDEIAIVAPAERWARGDFVAATNAYWGPLASWLIAPFLWLGAPAILATRLVSLAVGAATLVAAKRLANAFELPHGLQFAFLLLLVPYLLYFAVPFLLGDVPMTCLLILYFAVIFDPLYGKRRMDGALCGLLGGCAYLAKVYALPFFLVHFTLCSIILYLARPDRAERLRVLRHLAAGLGVFAILALGWVAALHQKYGVITIGINGQYTYEIFGPESLGRPIFYIGFVRPPDLTAVSMLEDPSYYYALPEARACCLKKWSPLESAAAFKHQLRLIKRNAGVILGVFIDFSPVAPAVVAVALAFCLAPLLVARRREKGPPASAPRRSAVQGVRDAVSHVLGSITHLRIVLALTTLTVFTTLYALISVEERYLWPMLILIVALGMHLLALAFRSDLFSKPIWQAMLTSLFVLSFLPLPLQKLKPDSALRESTVLFGRQLEGLNLAGASFASNTDYGTAICVGYHVKAKYYGQPPPGMSDEDIAQDLQRKGVNYYFVWDTPAAPRPGMDLVRAFTAVHRTLAVYAVRPADRPA